MMAMRTEAMADNWAKFFFYLYDKNGDNVLDKEEFIDCIKCYGRSA